ncbi:hypothetical protein [Rhodococcus rhodnii]|uniref:hypothetical protein n=1 Tax=Rhodococcus rhodnii TaxID=38312 RepID=UPI00039C9068|nr:hypothetical protein [Rhodococcus rhodnii]
MRNIGRTRQFRRAATAVVAAVAIAGAGSALTAPVAGAEPAGDARDAQVALEGITSAPQDVSAIVESIEIANAILDQFGITPFTPTVGACTDLSFPLAVAGAVPGPATPPIGDLSFSLFGSEIDLNAVRRGEVLYGFVPTGVRNDSADKSGMKVAWFNVNTFQGGFGEPMGGISDVILDAVVKRIEGLAPGVAVVANRLVDSTLRPVLNRIPQNGVRGGLVDTGQGTVLSAIYGTVNKGDATCVFFPSLGIATAA